KRMPRDHAEREVDGARQRGVDDHEQQRRADAAARPLARARGQLGGSPLRVAHASPAVSRAHAPRPRLTSTYSRPAPAAMNSTPSSSRAEPALPCPLTVWTTRATPIASLSSENT